eukprot:g10404.t1
MVAGSARAQVLATFENVLKVSGLLAVYGLFVMYKATHELLHDWKTTAKFLSVKLIIGLSTLQKMLLRKIVEVFPPHETRCLLDPLHPKDLDRALAYWSSYLTLLETILLACLVIKAFPAEEVADYPLKNLDFVELELRQIHQKSRSQSRLSSRFFPTLAHYFEQLGVQRRLSPEPVLDLLRSLREGSDGLSLATAAVASLREAYGLNMCPVDLLVHFQEERSADCMWYNVPSCEEVGCPAVEGSGWSGDFEEFFLEVLGVPALQADEVAARLDVLRRKHSQTDERSPFRADGRSGEEFSPQGLVNTLWGFATLECLGKSSWQLINALLEEIIRRLPDCTTQELSNSSWACCRLGVRHDGFLAAVASEGLKKVAGYTCQDLANTAMAFAKPNVYHEHFLQALAHHAGRKMRQFEAREVVNACWSFRHQLRHWSSLEKTFHDRVFTRVVGALDAIIGRDQGLLGMSEPLEAPVAPAPSKLLNAGPATHGHLAGSVPERLSPLEAARRSAQRLIDELQVDFLGPIFTRVAMRDLGFIDPRDRRQLCAFARAPTLGFMWFDRFGPHERRVISWISFELKVEISSEASNVPCMETLSERGRICSFSLDEHRAMDKRGLETFARLEAQWKGEVLFTLQDVRKGQLPCNSPTPRPFSVGIICLNCGMVMVEGQEWLQGLFAQHDRAGHTERQALLEIILEIISAIRQALAPISRLMARVWGNGDNANAYKDAKVAFTKPKSSCAVEVTDTKNEKHDASAEASAPKARRNKDGGTRNTRRRTWAVRGREA